MVEPRRIAAAAGPGKGRLRERPSRIRRTGTGRDSEPEENTMNTNNGNLQKPAASRFDETLEFARTRGRRRQQAMLAAWVGATGLALIATIALLEGCGGSEPAAIENTSGPASGDASASQNVVAAMPQLQGHESNTLTQPLPIETSDELRSVPPDVIAAVSDTFVTAGQAIEVSVEGTPDITSMALSDGRGDAIPMVRDSSSNCWRVNYRVPLRPRTDRLGLSVTAQNDSHRWRRVWVFLTLDDGRHTIETETPDELGDVPQEK